MYHWESVKIVGEWASVGGEWLIRVDCARYHVPPDMLEGRCISVKGLRQRLGDLTEIYKAESYYFKPWKTEDFCASPQLQERLRRGYMVEGEEREHWERDLRQELKSIAARVRHHKEGPKNLEAWSRWALEVLDNVLLAMAANGQGEVPVNQFERSPITNAAYLSKALQWYGRC